MAKIGINISGFLAFIGALILFAALFANDVWLAKLSFLFLVSGILYFLVSLVFVIATLPEKVK